MSNYWSVKIEKLSPSWLPPSNFQATYMQRPASLQQRARKESWHRTKLAMIIFIFFFSKQFIDTSSAIAIREISLSNFDFMFFCPEKSIMEHPVARVKKIKRKKNNCYACPNAFCNFWKFSIADLNLIVKVLTSQFEASQFDWYKYYSS